MNGGTDSESQRHGLGASAAPLDGEHEFRLAGGPAWAFVKYFALSFGVSCMVGFVAVMLCIIAVNWSGPGKSSAFLDMLPPLTFTAAVVFSFWFCGDLLIYRVFLGRDGIQLGHEMLGRRLEYEEVTFLSAEPRRDERGRPYPRLVIEARGRQHVIKLNAEDSARCFAALRPRCSCAAAVGPLGEESLPPNPEAQPRGHARLLANRFKAMLWAWIVAIFAIGFGGLVWYSVLVAGTMVWTHWLLLPAGLAALGYALAQTKKFIVLWRMPKDAFKPASDSVPESRAGASRDRAL